MTFRELKPSLFRRSNGLVYSKLTNPVSPCSNNSNGEEKETYNAILITSGELYNIDEKEEVIPF